ncbi:ABC transporter permease [Pontibacter sp. BT310]|uniref:Transport permease protein n=1 Tax=Pontibacter populi TaxID=890055 RepID=A0ABS6XHN3_9BACT|nr:MULTISPECIES: ABC transporter permease [Pontibacter]MBJ6119783.1 ABC transporter permease [Pontibacter sp. BT310]MBR0572212.1 ABC transporter permease [Microvirga sp. STS03]MBW3366636.1 ABC transporter permease [Pontibacter populi]
MKTKDEEWTLIIEPKSNLFDLRLREVWQYKDLLFLFVKRDFKAAYKQTILGPLWHFIQPLFTTIVFLVVFNKIAEIPTDGVPPTLFYMSGIAIWNYFASCLTATSNTFLANAGIFGKVYFPRLILPISIVTSNVIKFGIQFLLLLVVMIYYMLQGNTIHFGISWFVIPFLVLMMALLGLGLGIIISSLTTKYRDFTVLLGFTVQLLMYATPIVYPLSFLINKSYGWLISWNPLTPIVEAFRYALFEQGTFSLGSLLYSLIFIAIIFVIGLITFNRVERSFMDTV